MMPLFPDEDGDVGTAAISAGSGSTWCRHAFHHAVSRTWPAAALATVIGGPAVDFTGVVPTWARTTVKLSQMNGNNGWVAVTRTRLSGRQGCVEKRHPIGLKSRWLARCKRASPREPLQRELSEVVEGSFSQKIRLARLVEARIIYRHRNALADPALLDRMAETKSMCHG